MKKKKYGHPVLAGIVLVFVLVLLAKVAGRLWRAGMPMPQPPEMVEQTETHIQAPGMFGTEQITVYKIGGNMDEITDPAAILALEETVKFYQWKALTKPEDQVMAEPDYVLDLNNGYCFGLLGDGYVIWGTGFAYLDEAETRYEIADGVQYQVNREFTDQLRTLTEGN